MNAREFADGIRQMARRLDEDDEAAFALWSWLPSEKAAAREHGDYASEHRPSNADVMREACAVLAYVRGYNLDAEDIDRFRCPCGECKGADEATESVRGRVEKLYPARLTKPKDKESPNGNQ